MTSRPFLGIASIVLSASLSFVACGGGGGANPEGDAGSDAKTIQCVVTSDCNDFNACTLDACVDNVCEHELAPDGDALEQVKGDCRKTVCKSGISSAVIDNGDVPDDNEPCTLDICKNGLPSSTPKLDDTSCTIGKGSGQCKGGVCYVLCTAANAATQCDDQNPCTSDACLPCGEPECNGKGRCSNQGLSGMPTPGVTQTPGDCRERRCVEGKDEAVEDNYDPPNDGNECTVDLCKSGEPGHLPQSVGTACGGGSYKCNTTGECVQCLSVADCSLSAGKCNKTVCASGSCELEPLPLGTVCGANGEQCGASGSCCESCVSMGMSCGSSSNSCGESLDCGSCATGQICHSNSCCAPKQCVANACGSQSDGCGGTITCPSCPGGQICYSDQCCTPKSCGAGSCGSQSDGCGGTISCGSCAPGDSCSSGTCGCANGSKNTSETDVDCGGVCATKCAQGLKCLAGSDCTTGYCVDGVCCNSDCTGVCKACTSALTGQTTGLCANVTDGTDPGSECAATPAASCGTTGVCKAGACELHGTSAQCGAASCSGNVQSFADHCDGLGSCIDGGQVTCASPYVCAATTCQSCSDGVKNGNEVGVDCGGGGSCPGCPSGTACASGSDCANGLCVDGFCCNSACTGLCAACNVSGKAGTCSPIPYGADPANECPGTKTCNGAGGCT
jgi:hypothetical protein